MRLRGIRVQSQRGAHTVSQCCIYTRWRYEQCHMALLRSRGPNSVHPLRCECSRCDFSVAGVANRSASSAPKCQHVCAGHAMIGCSSTRVPPFGQRASLCVVQRDCEDGDYSNQSAACLRSPGDWMPVTAGRGAAPGGERGWRAQRAALQGAALAGDAARRGRRQDVRAQDQQGTVSNADPSALSTPTHCIADVTSRDLA